MWSNTFPEVVEAMDFHAVLDGELLVMRDSVVAPFADLQQRLGRKVVGAKMLRDYPVRVRLYDILFDGAEDLRALPFDARRVRLEQWFARVQPSGMDLSATIPFATIAELSAIRDGTRAASIEGLMLKRADSPYVPGRPKGQWWKWKRDPLTVDAVMMYAQRGHGKRSSYYSDYTFGLWREDGELVPVGKAYSGFTDAELVATGIAGSATTPPTGLARCAKWSAAWCWRSRSTRHNAPTGTNPAWHCGFPASPAYVWTNRRRKRTGSRL